MMRLVERFGMGGFEPIHWRKDVWVAVTFLDRSSAVVGVQRADPIWQESADVGLAMPTVPLGLLYV